MWKLRGHHRGALAQGKGKKFVVFIWLECIFGTVLEPAAFFKSSLVVVVVVVVPICKFFGQSFLIAFYLFS